MATIDRGRLVKLIGRAKREVDEGLLPSCQIAVGYDGEIVAAETFGAARADDRYCIFSATKPFVASTVWTLIAEGKLRVEEPVVAYFPEFGGHGKEGITVEQVMLHTSGFPHAPLGPPDWFERRARRAGERGWQITC